MTKALIVLAEGFEELEAVTVMDLLVRAEIKITSAGLKPGPVRASRNTVLVPDEVRGFPEMRWRVHPPLVSRGILQH